MKKKHNYIPTLANISNSDNVSRNGPKFSLLALAVTVSMTVLFPSSTSSSSSPTSSLWFKWPSLSSATLSPLLDLTSRMSAS